MISTSSTVQRMRRHEEFAEKENQPQIHRNLINANVPDKKDVIFDYWERAKMTSSGTKLG